MRSFTWAVEKKHAATNPARDVSRIKYASGGYHSWTPEEVEKFEQAHPIGSKPRLALALLMYTGVRRSDVVRLGRQHVRDGWFRIKQHKNRNRHPIEIEDPILPELQRIIDASPTGDLTFLVTAYGRPFTAAGFGIRFREWCNKAGLLRCTAHGLRKAGAALAAENGATEHQLMAIFGWQTIEEAERYTKAARCKKNRVRAASLSAPRQSGARPCTSGVRAQGGASIRLDEPARTSPPPRASNWAPPSSIVLGKDMTETAQLLSRRRRGSA